MAQDPALTFEQIRDIILRDSVVREKIQDLATAIATVVAQHTATVARPQNKAATAPDKTAAPARPATPTKFQQSRTPTPRTYEEYTGMSKATIRTAYHYWIKRYGYVPDALNQALAERFPMYNPEQRNFTGTTHFQNNGRAASPNPNAPKPVPAPTAAPQKPEPAPAVPKAVTPAAEKQPVVAPAPQPTVAAAEKQPGDIPPNLYSNMGHGRLYTLVFDSADKNYKKQLLKRSQMPYTVTLWDKKSNLVVVRKMPDDKPGPALFIINAKHGNLLNEVAHGTSEVRYNPATHELFSAGRASGSLYTWSFAPGRVATKVMSVPADAPRLYAYRTPRETVIIDMDGQVQRVPVITLPDARYGLDNVPIMAADEAEEATATPPDTNTPDKTDTPAKKSRRVSKDPHKLLVIVEPVKMTLDGTYNNVFVNGKLVLKNHINTMATTFLDGTVLGLYGIAADDDKLPNRPLWQIMDTDMCIRTFAKQNTYASTHNYVEDVSALPGKLRLLMNNHSSIYIEAVTALARAKGRVFEIATRGQENEGQK